VVTGGTASLVVQVDGGHSLSAGVVAALGAACDSDEDRSDRNTVILHVSGTPQGPPDDHLTVALVSKWERVLRRLERLPAATIAVASGECGGLALEALLATDDRIATPSVRLRMPALARATWPGMVLFRLARQVGATAIRRAVLFGDPISAAEAVAMGLIDELTTDTTADLAAATALAEAIPRGELAIRRQLMQDALSVSFEDAFGAHLAACDRALRQASAGAAR
jgi:isomerase DpgB